MCDVGRGGGRGRGEEAGPRRRGRIAPDGWRLLIMRGLRYTADLWVRAQRMPATPGTRHARRS